MQRQAADECVKQGFKKRVEGWIPSHETDLQLGRIYRSKHSDMSPPLYTYTSDIVINVQQGSPPQPYW